MVLHCFCYLSAGRILRNKNVGETKTKNKKKLQWTTMWGKNSTETSTNVTIDEKKAFSAS